MLTSTPEFKAVLRMLHDSGREVTPDELLACRCLQSDPLGGTYLMAMSVLKTATDLKNLSHGCAMWLIYMNLDSLKFNSHAESE